MKRSSLRLTLLTVGLLLAGAQAHARREYQLLDDQPTSVKIERNNWEASMGAGYAFLQDAPIITQTTTNPFAIFGFPDEFAVVTTEGRMHNGVTIHGGVFRKFSKTFLFGAEATYHVRHKIDAVITQASSDFFTFTPDFVTSEDEIFELMPAVKFQAEMDNLRLFLAGGVGWASIHRKTDSHWIVGGTDFNFRQGSQHHFAAANAGGGLEYALWEDGSFALDMRYHAIFDGNPLRMIIPTLRFDYHF